MKKSKALLPVLLTILLILAIFCGFWMTHQSTAHHHILLRQQTAATNMVPAAVQANEHDQIIADNMTNHQNPQTVKVQETPYGKLVTAKESGVKNGVHYEIIKTQLLPKNARIHRPTPEQVVLHTLPNGTVIAKEMSTGRTQPHQPHVSHQPVGFQQAEHNMLVQQAAIEALMQQQMQAVLHNIPVRFHQPDRHNPNH